MHIAPLLRGSGFVFGCLALFATAVLAQQPPAFTYYRLPEPEDSNASRAHAVAINASGTVLVGGEARVESVMAAYISIQQGTHVAGWSLPTPDSTVDSGILAAPDFMFLDPPETILNGVGSFSGGPGGGRLPMVWYDSTANDSMDYEYLLLPTIGADGTGEALGLGYSGDFPGLCLCGWSAPSGDVRHAVAWTADSIPGPYTLEMMEDYGPGYPSQANDGVVREDSTVLVVGWAVTPTGPTLPQQWQRDQEGTWTRELMPLPVGAVAGGVKSIDFMRSGSSALFTATGWWKDGFGEKHAALWTKAEGSRWVAEDLGTFDDYLESAALGTCIGINEVIPDSSFDVYAVGTSYTDEDSVAVLWKRDHLGTVTVHSLNDRIVNGDSLDLSLRIATSIDAGGPESLLVITGWGIEMDGTSPLTSLGGPHAYLLNEEPAAASVGESRAGVANLGLSVSPSPFSSVARVSYSLGRSKPMRLAVYDVEGRVVTVLADGIKPAGEQAVTWEGLDSRGRRSGSGMYFLRLEAGDRAVTRKMVFLR